RAGATEEMVLQSSPKLGRSPAVVKVPQPDPAKAVGVDKVVLLAEGDGVVPVQLARAAEPGVVPDVPSLHASRVGLAMGGIAAGLHLEIRSLARCVEVGIRDHARRRVLVGSGGVAPTRFGRV